MGFCKRKNATCECISETSNCNSDNCYRKLSDVSFKERLTHKAEEYIKIISIEEHIEYIKKEIEENFKERHYTVSLIEVLKPPVAIGRYNCDSVSLFVPNGIEPEEYRQMFVEEFNKLGFQQDVDMFISTKHFNNFNSYNITLKW